MARYGGEQRGSHLLVSLESVPIRYSPPRSAYCRALLAAALLAPVLVVAVAIVMLAAIGYTARSLMRRLARPRGR